MSLVPPRLTGLPACPSVRRPSRACSGLLSASTMLSGATAEGKTSLVLARFQLTV